MPTEIIPTRADLSNYDQTVGLGAGVFGLKFRHNAREDAWYMDLLDEAGAPLREGLRCVPNWALLRTFSDRARPLGELVVVDFRARPEVPRLAELGSQVLLAFVGP